MNTTELFNTQELSTEELKVSTLEVDMILLQEQLTDEDNPLRSTNPIKKLFRKIFRGNN